MIKILIILVIIYTIFINFEVYAFHEWGAQLLKTLTDDKVHILHSEALYEGTEVCLKEGVECPEANEIKYQRLANYSQYCQCSNGRPYLYSCPSGLVFNPYNNVCDYVKKETKFVLGASLNERISNLLEHDELSHGSNVCQLEGAECSGDNRDVPVFFKIEDSPLYCQCSNGSLHLYSCPPNQVFKTDRNVCEYVEENPSSEELNTGTMICKFSGVVCPSRNGDGPKYFALNHSIHYCECSNGRPYLFTCPDGEFFDTEINTCD